MEEETHSGSLLAECPGSLDIYFPLKNYPGRGQRRGRVDGGTWWVLSLKPGW